MSMTTELTRIIEQWEQHDRFRDIDLLGEPDAVRLAKAMLQRAMPLLDEAIDILSECAVEIVNHTDSDNIIAKRARATMKAISDQLNRWHKQENKTA